MIELIVKNKNFENIVLIDTYTSLIWTTAYNDIGDFELCVSVSKHNLEILKVGYYLSRLDDYSIGIIENLQITKLEEDEYLLVTGRLLESIISRRIIEKQTKVNGTVSSCITKLLNENLISPADIKRKISNFRIVGETFNDKLVAQYTGKNLLEVIVEICKNYNLGFRVSLNNGFFEFELYRGIDRSYNQNYNAWVVFSNQYDNLISSEYMCVSSQLVTDVLVAGEGEGLNRRTLWVSNNINSGLNRYEEYKDARNISSEDGVISDEEYNQQLKEDGQEFLTKITTSFNGEIYFNSIEYKKDLFLGDFVTIQNTEWGMQMNVQLSKITESVSETKKYTVEPTFIF